MAADDKVVIDVGRRTSRRVVQECPPCPPPSCGCSSKKSDNDVGNAGCGMAILGGVVFASVGALLMAIVGLIQYGSFGPESARIGVQLGAIFGGVIGAVVGFFSVAFTAK